MEDIVMNGTATMDQIRWLSNLHVMFTEHPLLNRAAAAGAAGFREVECWWPFDGQPCPSSVEVEEFVDAVLSAPVHLTAMNLYAGTMAENDRGVVSHPEKLDAFRASLDTALAIGSSLGTRLFNVPYGRRLAGVPEEVQDAAAVEALSTAAKVMGELNGTILVEPLSGFADYPVRTSQAALDIIDRVRTHSGQSNIGLLLDQYHLTTNGEDVQADLDFVIPYLSHVQIADVPDRGAPGSGDGEVRSFVESLLSKGYNGAIALEYRPKGSTDESLTTWRRAFGLGMEDRTDPQK